MQDYDHKKISYIIADGGSSDHVLDIVKEYYGRFKQVCFFVSDRNKLPLKLKYGNPAIDYNVSVSQSEDDLVLRCDPEVVFRNKDMLRFVSSVYDNNCDYLLHFNTIKVNKEFNPSSDVHMEFVDRFALKGKPYQTDASFCVSYSKRFFMEKMRGYDERFAYNYYCGEDTYASHWVRINYKFITAPFEYSPIHLWHEEQMCREDRERVVTTETVPFIRMLQSKNENANCGIDNWWHPEIITNKIIFNAGGGNE
jgi:hypothetical protein